MKTTGCLKWLAVATCAGLLGGYARAGETPPSTPGVQSQTRASAPQRDVSNSPGVGEVLEMLQAGVSKEVVRAYVENSPVAYQLSSADIIALKARSVPDEITAAMVKRGAALQRLVATSRRGAQRAMNNAQPSRANQQATFDPEGYDFWYYHYAYPRTLAWANQRLLSSYYALPQSYYWGYYPPLPFMPQ